MDLFAGLSPEQLALVDKLRQVARGKVAIEEAQAVTQETVRRIAALDFWRRQYYGLHTRFWSTVAWLFFSVSKLVPGLRASAVSAGRRVMQPPGLWPELRSRSEEQPLLSPEENSRRKAAALGALSDGVISLSSSEGGRLSIEAMLQVEELTRRIDAGADESQIRDALKRIREGETLVQTLARRA